MGYTKTVFCYLCSLIYSLNAPWVIPLSNTRLQFSIGNCNITNLCFTDNIDHIANYMIITIKKRNLKWYGLVTKANNLSTTILKSNTLGKRRGREENSLIILLSELEDHFSSPVAVILLSSINWGFLPNVLFGVV